MCTVSDPVYVSSIFTVYKTFSLTLYVILNLPLAVS